MKARNRRYYVNPMTVIVYHDVVTRHSYFATHTSRRRLWDVLQDHVRSGDFECRPHTASPGLAVIEEVNEGV